MATILIIGCKGSGKTTFINRIITGDFSNKKTKDNQIGCSFFTLEECTNGIVTLIDTGNMKMNKITEILLDSSQYDGVITLYGNDNESVEATTELFNNITKNIFIFKPVCHVLTKIDLGNSSLLKKINYKNKILHSTKSCYNIYEPIEFILKQNEKHKGSQIKFFDL
jgi:GTPase SAR1 family protein